MAKLVNDIRETVIEFTDVDNVVCVSSSMRSWVTKIKNLLKKYPDDIKLVAANKDGSICVHCPVDWIKVSPPRTGRSFTEEQKKAAAERLRAYREGKNNVDSGEDDKDD